MLAVLALLSFQAPAPAAAEPRLPRCPPAAAAVAQPCTVPVRYSPSGLQALIGARDQIWWVNEDALTLVARPPAGETSFFCCTVYEPLIRIAGTDLAAVTLRVPRAREAVLDVLHLPARSSAGPVTVRGPEAPPAPPRILPPAGRIELITVQSAALGEARDLVVYVPPDISPGERLPVVYLADGRATEHYGAIAEAAARDRRAARVIIAGLSSALPQPGCANIECDLRTLEYYVDTEPHDESGRFGRHMRFVTNEVLPLVESRFPASPRREDPIVAGFSNGGAWALSAAQLRPELFGNVLAMSSGSPAAAAGAGRLGTVRVFAGAGLYEPEFLRTTRAAAELARRSGAHVRYRELVSGHSQSTWELLFAEGLAWLMPPRAASAD
jgi:enterochelin esterase-like enzyme